jgi:TPR repeat protein
VLKDDKQSVYWYQKAADQGYAEAQSNLGIAYAFGKGYNLLTHLCQKYTQSQDCIVLLPAPD